MIGGFGIWAGMDWLEIGGEWKRILVMIAWKEWRGSIVSVVSRSEKVMRVAREAHGLSGSFAPPRVVRF
jgi:hypothetical protein